MKKIVMICLCGLAAMSVLTGCSDSNTDGGEDLGTVTLGEYKGVKVHVAPVEVTDEEVDAKVSSALMANPKEVEVDRAAETGDVVNIDYAGKQDGVEFAGGTAESQDITLGSGKMIAGFEDGLVGTKKGDKKELNLTFPEDYHEEAMAGQSVVFEVTVNAVKVKEDAQLNDEFVQGISEYQTVDEYKNSIREALLEQKQESFDLQVQQLVLQNVVDNSQFKLKRNALSKRYNTRLKQYTEQAKMYGGSLAQLAQSNGMDEAGLKESIFASVEDDAKNQLVLNTIAANENITLVDEDRQVFARINGQTVEDVVGAYGQAAFDSMALNYKVMGFLAANAVNEAGAAEAAELTPEEPAAETTAAQ